ncbi:aminotransferase class I/II-fold pyridoxal phosphate-dependent enzyme [Catenuloplanes atrovinosus]|uniref:Aspartate/methionine/tyrosine aminotransferase n=1 Tax=Catenuloplanes atrovinosus TaxID=137266 RepID=A0AAE3YGQ7_9ACTN|nr:aminotransferase class I/II-fold pyridoxal phosphate-dependent enzyme [Catenuloplanes atrovinosus]MDR7273623.1 aspartate/methionine/tyrosine aminotransferase [Catenuloplanes atrovinosus]
MIPTQAAHRVALPDAPHNLTQHELEAMRARFNLAAAHSRVPAPPAVVDRLPELWRAAERNPQQEMEERFLAAFFRLHRQPTAAALGRTLLSYSASVAVQVAATLLMQRGASVALIEPCVDNVADILRHQRVRTQPLDESLLRDASSIYGRLATQPATDAVFLVDPNNPTGTSLLSHGRAGFEEVVRFCADHGRILVLDLSFAVFALGGGGPERFDLYQLLEDSGVSYLAIEDTGKTWPIRDAKCAMLTVSRDLWPDVLDIHTSVLLSVSPFVLGLLTAHADASAEDGYAAGRELIRGNREVAVRTLEGSVLIHQPPSVPVSVGWFRIADPRLAATPLHERLAAADVYALPGTYFYWASPARGERFLRIALARDPGVFAEGLHRLRAVLDR